MSAQGHSGRGQVTDAQPMRLRGPWREGEQELWRSRGAPAPTGLAASVGHVCPSLLGNASVQTAGSLSRCGPRGVCATAGWMVAVGKNGCCARLAWGTATSGKGKGKGCARTSPLEAEHKTEIKVRGLAGSHGVSPGLPEGVGFIRSEKFHFVVKGEIRRSSSFQVVKCLKIAEGHNEAQRRSSSLDCRSPLVSWSGWKLRCSTGARRKGDSLFL